MQTWIDTVLGSNTPYVTYAIPVFFMLMAVEAIYGWISNKHLYRLNDTINDLSCGILQQVLGIFMKTILFAGYLSIYNNYALLDMSTFSVAGKWAAAVVLFLGVDFCYYWFHRISHEANAPWAGHIVHHQSEEYNLAVALRQGTFQACFSWVFYLPLAWVGFPPVWFISMSAFNTIYQFWIHTKTIGKLGWFETIFNTPSHHRVHHGRNPKYLDKNHAGILIIWDRMFGTFQVEDEPVVYGITKPLSSWNPLWANFHQFVEIWEECKAAPYWSDKFWVWFMPPDWRPRGLTPRPHPPEVTPETEIKYDRRAPRGLSGYIALHFVITLVVSLMVLASRGMTPWELIIPAAFVTVSLVSIGALFDRREWALGTELLRLVSLVALAVGYTWNTSSFTPAVVVAVGVLLFSVPWLLAYRGDFIGEATPASVPSVESLQQSKAFAD